MSVTAKISIESTRSNVAKTGFQNVVKYEMKAILHKTVLVKAVGLKLFILSA